MRYVQEGASRSTDGVALAAVIMPVGAAAPHGTRTTRSRSARAGRAASTVPASIATPIRPADRANEITGLSLP
jgi:hypothetical protein